MQPGLANAFLVSFIESIADFGNPIVLGGHSRRALDRDLLRGRRRAARPGPRRVARRWCCSRSRCVAFFVQRRAARRGARYTTVAGKGDSGLPMRAARRRCAALALGVVAAVAGVHARRLRCSRFAGGFVETWGRDYTPTLRHYVKAFGIEWATPTRPALGAAPRGTRSGRRSSSRRSPRRSPPRSACSPPGCWRASASRPRRVRVRHHARVRDSGHGDRRVLHPRLQRAAVRDHRHRADHRPLLRVPQHAGRRARRHARR